jgi:hypothetical protein
MQVLEPDPMNAFEAEPTPQREAAPALPLGPAHAESEGIPYPMVAVEWHDAWFDQDQTDAEQFRTDYLVRTIGFLIHEGPHVITVAHEVLPDGDGFRAVTHIPVAIVERIHCLSPAAPDDVYTRRRSSDV